MATKKNISRKKKSKRSKKNGSALQLINFKAHPKEHRLFSAKAKKYTEGNLSALIRRAVLQYKPV